MATLTNNLIRLVKSLDDRKHRRKEMLFKAEGTKCVLDTLPFFTIRYLFVTPSWLKDNAIATEKAGIANVTIQCSVQEIAKMSSLVTPTEVIAVYAIPDVSFDSKVAGSSLILALDAIQDPGNLGTIIRVADWFGVRDIICGSGTVDCYSPKVIQATMGSISRVKMHYLDLKEVLNTLGQTKIYGTFLDGDSISDAKLSNTGVIVIGNEGNGISDEIGSLVTDRLLIPSYPTGEPTGESLNAAIATAITLAKFRGV